MKILTVCQPYASLIVSGQKLIENRTWKTNYHGPLAIHAGASNKYLCTWHCRLDATLPDPMPFSAILGVVDLIDCVTFADAYVKYPQLCGVHREGPFCWILSNPRRLDAPIEGTGAQGLRTVNPNLAAEILLRLSEQSASAPTTRHADTLLAIDLTNVEGNSI